MSFCRFEFTATAVNQGYRIEFQRWVRIYVLSPLLATRFGFPNNSRNDVFTGTAIGVPGALTVNPESNSLAVPAGQTVVFNPVPIVANYLNITSSGSGSYFVTIGYQ
jgi:hypothetical protein